MITKQIKQLRVAVTLLPLCIIIAALTIPHGAYAGPPLICHPLNIGSAKSLPSGDGPFGTKKDYNRERLVEETLDLLTADMPVIVRMETLRRATIYASGINTDNRKWSNYSDGDRRMAYELLSRLTTQALSTEAKEKSDATTEETFKSVERSN